MSKSPAITSSCTLATLANIILLLAGGVSALAFAPLNLWPLALLALVFLVARAAGAPSQRAAFARGWFFGAGQFIVGLNWIAIAFTYQSNMPVWLGWVSVVLLSLYLALFPALASMLAWRASHRRPLAFPFAFAAAWMLSEWLRATLLTGFAWNPLGVVSLSLPWVAQTGKWIGTYGLSGLVVLAAGLLWLGLQRRRIETVVFAVVAVSGALLLPTSMSESRESQASSSLPVRVVQPNIGQDEKYDSGQAERHEDIYRRLSGSPPPVPRLLLWPEAATLRFLDLEPEARTALGGLLGPHDLLVLGGQSVTLDPHNRADDVYRNSVFVLDSTGTIRWRYDKSHLVPFGEYLPMRSILGRIGLSRLVPGDGDFTAGPGPRSFPLPGFTSKGAPASVGVQICYEIIFPGRVVDRTNRPSFLFNPSNDAWFGPWGPPQHLAQARLRAIEEGLAVIRATPNGISAMIGPTGRVMATVPRHQAGVIDGFVPDPLPPPLFARLGNWASALFGIVLVAMATGATLIGRRPRRASTPSG